MKRPLDELYFLWLCGQVMKIDLKAPNETYWQVLKLLYTKEFVWIIPNDDNRIEDGRDLRYEFVDDTNLDTVDLDWINLGCSMFELLVGLSRRLAFEGDGESSTWFWVLMKNLGIHQYNDAKEIPEEEINHILDEVIWRTYGKNGRGGLFPLRHPTEDQREVELWYQLSAYLLEQI